jgi:hypothetical protein
MMAPTVSNNPRACPLINESPPLLIVALVLCESRKKNKKRKANLTQPESRKAIKAQILPLRRTFYG